MVKSQEHTPLVEAAPKFMGAKGVKAYYEQQSPPSMVNYLGKFIMGVSGLGFMGSSLLVYVVGKIDPHWFEKTLNMSRLDKYYWMLAVISGVNLVVFVIVATRYRYRQPIERGQGQEGADAGGGYTDGYNEGDQDKSCSCC
ncbi:hypothetical protein C2S52_006690 [Perilla frutescens var. hirtella]|nr:hypothetical protein C2S52_006690 [Perilla frutescens var. hirtella]